MTILLKQVIIIDKRSDLNGKTRDILIKDGIISKIDKNIATKADKIIDCPSTKISIGWMDIGTQIGEPGYEQRETLESVTQAAMRGGYTALAPFPNTDPVIQHKSDISFLKRNTQNKLVDFYPIAALTKDTKGENLTEILDLNCAGAVAFSDGPSSIQNNALLLRGLQYINACNSTIIHQAMDQHIADDGVIHEGETSLKIGTNGIPSMAETILVHRDIQLQDYAISKLLIHNISTKESAQLLKKAKKNNQKLSASVCYMHLVENEESLSNFDRNRKILPPLRAENDRRELLKALKEGVIDIITTNHVPIEEESKHLEFARSAFGAIGLETSFAVLNTMLRQVTIDLWIYAMSIAPRLVLGVDTPSFEVGTKAEFTLFDTDQKWTVEKQNLMSKSKNSPYLGSVLKGKVLGVINDKKSEFYI